VTTRSTLRTTPFPITDRHRNSTATGTDTRSLAVSAPVLLLVTVPYAIYLLPSEYVSRLTAENGPIELTGALALLVAMVMFIRAARLSVRSGTTGWRMTTLCLVGLALLSSLAFMEEISWGQQLLKFHTPELIKHYNVQSETNLHNLRWFQGTDALGHDKSFWAKTFSSERLFNLFWFLYFAVVPVSAVMSPRIRGLVARWSVPLAPVALSSVFVLHYLEYRIFDALLGDGAIHITEVSEFNIEVLFAFVAAAMLFELKQRRAGALGPDARPSGTIATPA